MVVVIVSQGNDPNLIVNANTCLFTMQLTHGKKYNNRLV